MIAGTLVRRSKLIASLVVGNPDQSIVEALRCLVVVDDWSVESDHRRP